MLTDEEVKQRIIEAHKIRRWYQKIPYSNIKWPVTTHFEDGKTNSLSYGESRWLNYLAPILDRNADGWHNSSLCDVGCSAGLFLLRAWNWFHFRRLIGIEAANGGYEQLELTRDYYDKMPLSIHKAALGKLVDSISDSDAPPIDLRTFPIVDVTIMSCVHYHMDITYLKSYLKGLASKSLYFLLLTDERAGGPINATSNFFKNNIISREWVLKDAILTRRDWLGFDPPCKDLTAMFFKSKLLKRLPVKECFEKQMNWHEGRLGKHKDWAEFTRKFYVEVFPPFIEAVLKGDTTEKNHKNCLVYECQRKGVYGSTPWDESVASERTLSYINIVKTMNDHGQEQPIGLQEHYDMVDPWDGWHRVAVLKHLGYKYVYGKDV